MRMRMIVNRFARFSLPSALLALLCLPGSLLADVLERSDSGFTIEHVVHRTGDGPAATWARLIEPARWWHPDHTWSGDAATLSLEATAGGCFCEALANGGSNEHLRVVHAAPDRLLRLDGRLGPLQSLAVTGVMTFELAPVDDGTRITLRYAVAGTPGSGLGEWADPVDFVLGQQAERLAANGEAERTTE